MRPRKQESGFTLIEIMVVVIIVGVIASAAFLSMGSLRNDRALTDEARRFIALASVALDEAAMQGREFGLELMTGSYRFVEYDAYTAQWGDVLGDDTLRLRDLTDELEFELFVEGRPILLDDNPASIGDPDADESMSGLDAYAPHLLIYSSGDATPFELHIFRNADDLRVVMRGNALGDIEIVDPDEI